MHPSNWKNYFHRSTLQVQFKSGTAERPATAAQREFLAASPAGSSVGCVYGCPCHRAQDKQTQCSQTSQATKQGNHLHVPPTTAAAAWCWAAAAAAAAEPAGAATVGCCCCCCWAPPAACCCCWPAPGTPGGGGWPPGAPLYMAGFLSGG